MLRGELGSCSSTVQGIYDMPRAGLKSQVCFAWKRNPSFDQSTFPNFRANLESPSRNVRAFLHALQAETLFASQFAHVESDALIGNGDDEFVALFAQTHAGPVSAAMPFEIAEPFLDNSEETKSHVVCDGTGHTFMVEINCYGVLSRELSAQCADSENYSEAFQRRRM